MNCEILRYCPDSDMLNVIVKSEFIGVWYTYEDLVKTVGELSAKKAISQFFEEK